MERACGSGLFLLLDVRKRIVLKSVQSVLFCIHSLYTENVYKNHYAVTFMHDLPDTGGDDHHLEEKICRRPRKRISCH